MVFILSAFLEGQRLTPKIFYSSSKLIGVSITTLPPMNCKSSKTCQNLVAKNVLKNALCYCQCKAWFPYDRWRSLTIAGIASKVFSDRNDHMETKFSFCQRSPTIPATANDRNDHDRWDRIRVYLCDRSDREGSSSIAKS